MAWSRGKSRAPARLALLSCVGLASCGHPTAPASAPERVVIDLAAGPVARFSPAEAFGAVIDGLGKGRVEQTYSPVNIAMLKRAGFGPMVYNLRTELGIEAWHWTSEGQWSDPRHAQGYWISSDHPRRPVWTAWGYALPRRGDTTDQANDDGYSRLDDGDRASFWKSNPYLDPLYAHYAGGDQWAVANFTKPVPISAARIDWALPYATRFELQYWAGRNDTDPQGRWLAFPQGKVSNGKGGAPVIAIAAKPIAAQFVRILLQQSSHMAPRDSTDRRDAMGYAIREIGLGTRDAQGQFRDAIVHSHSGPDQTNIYVSSTDPWHRARDRDPETEQPGFDRIFRSGLTNGLPITLNVGALYDTPENTAAQIRFFRRRHYPLREVEIGMEPDGQNIDAAAFAALFIQTADAIHAVDPRIKLAGPGLQDAKADTWLVEGHVQSWTRLFLDALRKHGHLGALRDFTFEHYPYDVPCGALDSKLRGEDAKMRANMAQLTADGVPPGMSRSILEYGFSAFSGEIEVQMPEALFNADMIAHFLTLGGHASYYLGYGPEELFDPENTCAGYGELMLFGQDDRGRATWATPSFWGARLLTQAWAQPGAAEHLLYRAKWLPGQARDAGGNEFVVAYPLRRPDGRLAVLLINRDPARAHVVDVQVMRSGNLLASLHGPYEVFQYGADQYRWQAAGPGGHPTRDQPPRHVTGNGPISLPGYSMTVLRVGYPR